MNKRKGSRANLKIRSARLRDLDQLLQIEAVAFEEYRLSRQSLLRHIKSKRNKLRVAVTDGAICGYALVFLRSNSCAARLYSIAVLPHFRGQGVASSLLDHIIMRLPNWKRSVLTLEVKSSNSDAKSLYQSYGFVVSSTLGDYYGRGQDGIRMKMVL